MSHLKKAMILAAGQSADAAAARDFLRTTYNVTEAADKFECLAILKERRFDLVLIDIGLLTGDRSFQNDLNQLREELGLFFRQQAGVDVIAMTAAEAIRDAVLAVKSGAAAYIRMPATQEEVSLVVESVLEERRKASELDWLRDQFGGHDAQVMARTQNPMMKAVLNQARSVARTRTTVLLSGETGVGKGLIARLIHQHSNRCDKQFVGVHCGAAPDPLLERDLFGIGKGATAHDVKRKMGAFEIARSGTLFLDNIGAISFDLQLKLFQALPAERFQRLVGQGSTDADVRIIAATNMDLGRLVDAGTFRRDLYLHLNIFRINIPSLRERKEDIPILVETFLERLNQFHDKDIHAVHPLVMDAFQGYCWPGNIRELENLVERAYILGKGPMLSAAFFPRELFQGEAGAIVPQEPKQSLAQARRQGIEHAEQWYLKGVLRTYKGRIGDSARHAGISTRQLHKLMTKYGIRKEEFKPRPIGIRVNPVSDRIFH